MLYSQKINFATQWQILQDFEENWSTRRLHRQLSHLLHCKQSLQGNSRWPHKHPVGKRGSLCTTTVFLYSSLMPFLSTFEAQKHALSRTPLWDSCTLTSNRPRLSEVQSAKGVISWNSGLAPSRGPHLHRSQTNHTARGLPYCCGLFWSSYTLLCRPSL